MFETLVQFVEQSGYIGIFLLMVAENVFPPIPSEIIMPLAGFSAARGDLSLAGVIAVGTLGSVVGAVPWYLAGLCLGRDRLRRFAASHGRWTTVSGEDFDNAYAWFERHGYTSVFFGRLIPTIRTVISAPAGVVHMPITIFLLITAAGSALWNSLLAMAGYLLESQYGKVSDYLDPLSWAVLAGIIIIYVYRVITYEPEGAEAE